ncbi:MAG: dihydropteroate synthase-like protein [Candidatus Lokiarchaeota archaeon]|nr:dihydropteroate synthase-like protein [Candidatus Lokiarchaeota archaeon]
MEIDALKDKILILTGKLAEKDVKKYIQEFPPNQVEVKVLNVSLAAFMTPKIIIESLKNVDLSEYGYIMAPGLMVGNLDIIEKKLGKKIFLGPKYACDIPLVIKSNIKLSKKISADKLLLNQGINEYEEIVKNVLKDFEETYSIGSVKIGKGLPPVILAEIVDAPKLGLDRIISKAKYYLKYGADMIDVGATVGEDNSSKIQNIIETLKFKLDAVPISIDSLNPAEIEAGVEAGADLVLSLDEGNIADLTNLDKEVCYTIIPTNVKQGIFPKIPSMRLEKLEENIILAEKHGFKKILADPLLESPINPGLMNSLITYQLFKNKYPSKPMMAGLGNVFELIDADSIGINALLASLVVELNISVCLTTEYSKKARNAIDELSTGLKMSFLAQYKNQPPNGLSFDLLKAKSKKDFLPEYEIKNEKQILTKDESYKPDPKGYYKIWVNHTEKKIYVNYFSNDTLIKTISGLDAESIGKSLFSMKTLSKLEHAIYLGRELQKAEICLYLGKSYSQDVKFQKT